MTEQGNDNNVGVSSRDKPTKKGRKSTAKKGDTPKKAKNQGNKEDKAEKEKKREENKRKKEISLQKNAEFLQSLDVFKQKVTSSTQPMRTAEEQQNHSNSHAPHQQWRQEAVWSNPQSAAFSYDAPGHHPYQAAQPFSFTGNPEQNQNNAFHYGNQYSYSSPSRQPYSQPDSTSASPYFAHHASPYHGSLPGFHQEQHYSTPASSQQRGFNAPASADHDKTYHPLRPNFSKSYLPAASSQQSAHAELPGRTSSAQDGDQILDDFLERTDGMDDSNEEISPMSPEEPLAAETNEREDYKALLEAKEQELQRMKQKLSKAEKELEKYRTSHSQSKQSGEWKTQTDGMPRAGVVPKEIAENNGMMELLPQRGIYVYPKDIRIAGKKESGTAMARFLMSIFYTNEELIERGNLMGKNGKRGLDKKIVDAIVDYATIKGKDSGAEIKYSMRTKISAMVSSNRKRNSTL